MRGPTARVWWAASVIGASFFLAEARAGADENEPPVAPSEPGALPAEARADVYRPLGPSFFPFYEHYLRTADLTEVRNVLYLYTAADNPGGDWSRLLVPIFYREHSARLQRDLFYLFPLLYFQKRSPESSTTLALPLGYYHEKDPRSSTLHALFPLFRRRTEAVEGGELSKTRLGLWKVFELWESRREPTATDRAALSLFNWKEEGRGLLSLYRSSRRIERGEDGEEEVESHAHLFPFYFAGRERSSSYSWLIPFYGRSESPGRTDHYFPFLLSRVGLGGEDRRIDVLFPIFGYSSGPKRGSLAVLPFYDTSTDASGSSTGVLLWLYRTRLEAASGKRTHSILYPLGHFDVEPDGSQGKRWFIPYIETFDDKRLWRFVLPLYAEKQELSGGNTDWFLRIGIPLFLSIGEPDDYFTMGFPLLWASRSGRRGWELFAPLYFRAYSATSNRFHIFPLFSYRSFPSRKQVLVGGPLYVNETFYDRAGKQSGKGHHFLWPFFSAVSRNDGYLYRFLPLFAFRRDGDTTSRLITPLYYATEGPRGKGRYFFPAYGRYETDSLRRDFYGAGTYIHTVQRDAAGETIRDRKDILWSLATRETHTKTGASHEHVYPLLYWKTRTPAHDRTLWGPFHYSHRIAEGNEVDRLSLWLGSVVFSHVKEGPLPPSVTPAAAPPAAVPPADAAPVPDATADAAGATPEEEPASAPPVEARTLPPPVVGELSRDEGILWPLSRRYRSIEGEEGKWLIPFYFNTRDDLKQNLALFPFFFRQEEVSQYSQSYFRYFFLYDTETWRGGRRMSVGQVLFDRKVEEGMRRYRLRILYPIFEHLTSPEGREVNVTPFVRFASKDRDLENRIFPFYWQGATQRKSASGEWRTENSHFFLFPLYGFSSRQNRDDYYVLFPFFHLRSSQDSRRLELWPLFFYRREPGLKAVRIWPFHADESGLTAGEFWVSRFFFLSKRFRRSDSRRYRLDPFLFRFAEGLDEVSWGALFEAIAYERQGTASSYRLIPLVFGYSQDEMSATGIIPFYYRRNFGKEEIDYGIPWRFLFLTHSFRGASGERHFGVLWKLFGHTDNPNRPEYLEVRFLERLFFRRRTETSSQLEVNPLFSYYRDETGDESRLSILFDLYGYRRTRDAVEHRVLFFLRF